MRATDSSLLPSRTTLVDPDGTEQHTNTTAPSPRVLHILDTFEHGGAQRVALDLIRYSAPPLVGVVVVGRRGPLATEFRSVPGVVVVEHDAGSFLQELAQISAVIKHTAPDVVHAHQRREGLLANIAAKRFRLPVVEHAHTYLPSARGRRLSFRSDRIFAVSTGVESMLTGRFRVAPARVRMIGNTASRVSATPTTPWVAPQNRTVCIIGIGRLEEQKDPLRFVRVAAALHRIRPTTATWFGNGPLLNAARLEAARLDAPVTFVDHSDRITDEIDRSDAVVMTSGWEGMPLVVLETFARQRPLIATYAVGGDGALADGRARVIADDASDVVFAEAIHATLSSDATSDMLRAAAQFAEAQTPARVFEPVIAAYRELTRGAA